MDDDDIRPRDMMPGDDTRPTLRSVRLTLRSPLARDVVDRLAAGRDPEFRRMVGGVGPWPGPLTEADARRWYATLDAQPLGWAVEHEGRCIGEARLHGLEPAGRAWLAVGLFAPRDRGRGLGTETVRLLLGHAFDVLALREVALRVLAFNTPAIACYARCGFREVGREAVELGGEPAEDILMAVTAAEFRATPPGAAG